MVSDQSFRDWLKQRRKSLDLTQKELALQAGCSIYTVQRIEEGVLKPSRQLADLLATSLEIPQKEHQAFVRWARMPAADSTATVGRTDFGAPVGDMAGNGITTLTSTPAPGNAPQLINPYKGLRAFHEADAPDFFGREALSRRLRDRLDEESQLSRFLAVVGPSGSGKSSLVRAGLVPALRHHSLPGGHSPVMVDMIPGTRPLEELEAALLRVAVNPPSSLMEQLREDDRGLVRAVKRVLPGDDQAEMVLVIDQFEEVFTLVEDEQMRADFLDSLFSAVTDPRSRLWVVITLRADFYDRPLLYLPSSELLGQRTEVVGPLTPNEMYQAITGPAERVGLELERDLVATIMQDVGEQPGTLPLLQYTLTELYERREGRLLTLAAYHASGGVFGSLARRAESLYAGLTMSEQAATRQLFLRLVTLGEGVEDTRRRVLMSELVSAAQNQGNEEALHRVLALFGRYRMLTFDRNPLTREPTVEVAHEALLRTWGRLREWLEESREALHIQRRLMSSASEWRSSGQQTSYLAGGSRLVQFEGLASHAADSEGVALTAEEQAYLAASQEDQRKQEAAEQERHTRELALQKRAANRLRYLVAGLGLFLLVAAGLAINAQANFTRAEAQRLGFEADKLMQTNGSAELIALLSLRSMGLEYSSQGDTALEAAAALQYPRQQYVGHNTQVNRIEVSPDGRYILSAAFNAQLYLWDAHTGQKLHELAGHQTGEPKAAQAVFTPDGKQVVSWGRDKTIRVWDVASGKQLRQYKVPVSSKGSSGAGALSPDGKRVLVFTSDKSDESEENDKLIMIFDVQTGELLLQFPISDDSPNWNIYSPDGKHIFTNGSATGMVGQLWDAQTGKLVREFKGHTAMIYRAAFSPDGKYLVTGSLDKTARLWDVPTGQEVHRFIHSSDVYGVAYSPDGKYVLTADVAVQTARLWDVQTGLEVRQFARQAGSVNSVGYSPDGQYVLTGGGGGYLTTWDVKSETALPQLQGHTEYVSSVTVSLDGKYVLTGSNDKTARLWDVQTGEEMRQFLGHTDRVNRSTFSPDGKQVLTASHDGTARLWDAQTAQQVLTFTGHTGIVNGAVFSPDGMSMLTYSQDSTAILWDARTSKQVYLLKSHVNQVNSGVFSPNGKYALTGSLDETAILWDVITGREVMSYTGYPGGAATVSFSPDGKQVLIGDNSGTTKLLDRQTGDEIRQFIGCCGRLSPDGKYVLTDAKDNTARLWDAATGDELRRYADPAGAVWGAGFSRDSKFVFTVSDVDNNVRLWNTDYRDTIRYLCRTLIRDLTDDERAQYEINDKEPTCPTP
jgi:WD40 repeat protein/DNA-binding XRE family transcriptional regulator